MRPYQLLLLAIILSSCSGYQHIATPQYVPLNSKKGDLTGNVSFRYAQLGYTVSNNVSIFATGYMRDTDDAPGDFDTFAKKEGSGTSDHDDRSHEVNAGASFFKDAPKFNYEIHLGAGGGKSHYYHTKDFASERYYVEIDAKRSSIFIQPSFCYKIPKLNRFFQLGAFTKIAMYRYYDLDVKSYVESTNIDHKDLYFMNRAYRNLYFIEPGVCFRAGSKWIMGNVMMTMPLNLQGNVVRYREVNLYMSVFFKLNLLRRNKAL